MMMIIIIIFIIVTRSTVMMANRRQPTNRIQFPMIMDLRDSLIAENIKPCFPTDFMYKNNNSNNNNSNNNKKKKKERETEDKLHPLKRSSARSTISQTRRNKHKNRYCQQILCTHTQHHSPSQTEFKCKLIQHSSVQCPQHASHAARDIGHKIGGQT